MKTGILIHGLHLEISDWERVVWGVAPDMPGRLPHAMWLTNRYDVVSIVLGTGASKKDNLTEGEYAIQYLLDHWGDLTSFEILKDVDLDALRKKVEPLLTPENTSVRTFEEAREAGKLFREAGVEQILQVTDTVHAPRSLADALIHTGYPAERILATPSPATHEGVSPKDVAIFEPNHRPDWQEYDLHAMALAIIKYRDNKAFLNDIKTAITKHTK